MTQARSISLSKFTASVQAAVKAAVAKHPKFSVDVPNAITVSYLIRGIPAPESLLSAVTMAELQTFASEIAAHVADAHPEMVELTSRAPGAQGAVLSVGRHVILGIPPFLESVKVEK